MNQALQQILNQGIELRENDVWCKGGSHWARPENCTSQENSDKRLSFTCIDHQ
jgi:hypothetical protein